MDIGSGLKRWREQSKEAKPQCFYAVTYDISMDIMSIRDLQKLMGDLYFERDRKRGVLMTYIWLISEVGELADALIEGDVNDFSEEAADVTAWLLSLCNLMDVDLEKAVYEKYGRGCPRCHAIPCQCEH